MMGDQYCYNQSWKKNSVMIIGNVYDKNCSKMLKISKNFFTQYLYRQLKKKKSFPFVDFSGNTKTLYSSTGVMFIKFMKINCFVFKCHRLTFFFCFFWLSLAVKFSYETLQFVHQKTIFFFKTKDKINLIIGWSLFRSHSNLTHHSF